MTMSELALILKLNVANKSIFTRWIEINVIFDWHEINSENRSITGWSCIWTEQIERPVELLYRNDGNRKICACMYWFLHGNAVFHLDARSDTPLISPFAECQPHRLLSTHSLDAILRIDIENVAIFTNRNSARLAACISITEFFLLQNLLSLLPAHILMITSKSVHCPDRICSTTKDIWLNAIHLYSIHFSYHMNNNKSIYINVNENICFLFFSILELNNCWWGNDKLLWSKCSQIKLPISKMSQIEWIKR